MEVVVYGEVNGIEVIDDGAIGGEVFGAEAAEEGLPIGGGGAVEGFEPIGGGSVVGGACEGELRGSIVLLGGARDRVQNEGSEAGEDVGQLAHSPWYAQPREGGIRGWVGRGRDMRARAADENFSPS